MSTAPAPTVAAVPRVRSATRAVPAALIAPQESTLLALGAPCAWTVPQESSSLTQLVSPAMSAPVAMPEWALLHVLDAASASTSEARTLASIASLENSSQAPIMMLELVLATTVPRDSLALRALAPVIARAALERTKSELIVRPALQGSLLQAPGRLSANPAPPELPAPRDRARASSVSEVNSAAP